MHALEAPLRNLFPVRWVLFAADEEFRHQCGGLIAMVGIYMKSGYAVFNDFQRPAKASGKGGQPGTHRLDDSQSKGLEQSRLNKGAALVGNVSV